MKRAETVFATTPLKILPAYTGATTIDEALRDPRGARLLWLELLVNDRLDLEPWREFCEFQAAYKKACRWYTMYRTVIEALIPRVPRSLLIQARWISVTTVCLQRRSVLSSVTVERLTESLEEYVRGTGASIDILLVGGSHFKPMATAIG